MVKVLWLVVSDPLFSDPEVDPLIWKFYYALDPRARGRQGVGMGQHPPCPGGVGYHSFGSAASPCARILRIRPHKVKVQESPAGIKPAGLSPVSMYQLVCLRRVSGPVK